MSQYLVVCAVAVLAVYRIGQDSNAGAGNARDQRVRSFYTVPELSHGPNAMRLHRDSILNDSPRRQLDYRTPYHRPKSGVDRIAPRPRIPRGGL